MARHAETHVNGAGIEIRGSLRYIRRAIEQWRSQQGPPAEQPEESPEPQGAHSQVETAPEHEDSSFYGYPRRPTVGFTP